MKIKLFVAMCLVLLMAMPASALGAPLAEETGPPEPTSSITVWGYGTASAAPDKVRVILSVGEEPTYGPGGPEIKFIKPDDVDHVRDFLIEQGVDASLIDIDYLSTNSRYGPGTFSGEIAFFLSELNRLKDILELLVDEMEDRRGPKIQSAILNFRVDDCGSLETEAMQTALDDARQRAGRMAAVLGKSVGPVRSVSEDTSSFAGISGMQQITGCVARDSRRFLSYSSYYGNALANTLEEVEISILMLVTFAIED